MTVLAYWPAQLCILYFNGCRQEQPDAFALRLGRSFGPLDPNQYCPFELYSITMSKQTLLAASERSGRKIDREHGGGLVASQIVGNTLSRHYSA